MAQGLLTSALQRYIAAHLAAAVPLPPPLDAYIHMKVYGPHSAVMALLHGGLSPIFQKIQACQSLHHNILGENTFFMTIQHQVALQLLKQVRQVLISKDWLSQE